MRVIIVAQVSKAPAFMAVKYLQGGVAQALIGAGIASNVASNYSDNATGPDGMTRGHAYTFTVDLEADGSYRRAKAVIDAMIYAATGGTTAAVVFAVTAEGVVPIR